MPPERDVYKRQPQEKAREEARCALELTGLKDKEMENPYDLELHERKLVAIASVLAMDTDVIILDEPKMCIRDSHPSASPQK